MYVVTVRTYVRRYVIHVNHSCTVAMLDQACPFGRWAFSSHVQDSVEALLDDAFALTEKKNPGGLELAPCLEASAFQFQ
jgi:hypothetical protein